MSQTPTTQFMAIDFSDWKNIKMQLRCHKQNIKKKINYVLEAIGTMIKVDDDIRLFFFVVFKFVLYFIFRIGIERKRRQKFHKIYVGHSLWQCFYSCSNSFFITRSVCKLCMNFNQSWRTMCYGLWRLDIYLLPLDVRWMFKNSINEITVIDF